MIFYQNGNEEAFKLLYKRSSRKVYGFLLKRLKNNETANDIFQSTFLKLHRGRHLYNPKFPFLPWLYTICKNEMNDYFRKKMNHHEIFNELAIENAVAAPAFELPDFSILPQSQKLALEMRYFDNLSFEEISKKLNTTSSNARQLISRAIRRIKGGENEKEL